MTIKNFFLSFLIVKRRAKIATYTRMPRTGQGTHKLKGSETSRTRKLHRQSGGATAPPTLPSALDKNGKKIVLKTSVMCNGLSGTKTFPVTCIKNVKGKPTVYSDPACKTGYVARSSCSVVVASMTAAKDKSGNPVTKGKTTVICKGLLGASKPFVVSDIKTVNNKVTLYNNKTAYAATTCSVAPSLGGPAPAAAVNSSGKLTLAVGKSVTCKSMTGTSKPFTIKTLKQVGKTTQVSDGKTSYVSTKCAIAGPALVPGKAVDIGGKPITAATSVTCKGVLGTSKAFKPTAIKLVGKDMQVFNGKSGYVANKKCTVVPPVGVALDTQNNKLAVGNTVTCKGILGTSKPFKISSIQPVGGKVQVFNGKTGYVSATKCKLVTAVNPAAHDTAGKEIKVGATVTCKGMLGTSKPFTVTDIQTVKGAVQVFNGKSGYVAATKCTLVETGVESAQDINGQDIKKGNMVECSGLFGKSSFLVDNIQVVNGVAKVYSGNTSYTSTKCKKLEEVLNAVEITGITNPTDPAIVGKVEHAAGQKAIAAIPKGKPAIPLTKGGTRKLQRGGLSLGSIGAAIKTGAKKLVPTSTAGKAAAGVGLGAAALGAAALGAKALSKKKPAATPTTAADTTDGTVQYVFQGKVPDTFGTDIVKETGLEGATVNPTHPSIPPEIATEFAQQAAAATSTQDGAPTFNYRALASNPGKAIALAAGEKLITERTPGNFVWTEIQDNDTGIMFYEFVAQTDPTSTTNYRIAGTRDQVIAGLKALSKELGIEAMRSGVGGVEQILNMTKDDIARLKAEITILQRNLATTKSGLAHAGKDADLSAIITQEQHAIDAANKRLVELLDNEAIYAKKLADVGGPKSTTYIPSTSANAGVPQNALQGTQKAMKKAMKKGTQKAPPA